MPEDDGGTPIKHFVVELCDITTNNLWTSVAMSDSGDSCEQMVQHLREGHKYNLRVAAANRIGQSETADLYDEVITKDPWGKFLIRIIFHRVQYLFYFVECASQCGRPTILDWTPTFVDISWTGPAKDGGAPITSFILEMKEASMRDWMENCSICVEDIEMEGEQYRGRCENLSEEYQYRFRVIAVNKAGKSLPGPSSDNVVAMHKNISPFIKVFSIFCTTLFKTH